jgi:hypothetical protein
MASFAPWRATCTNRTECSRSMGNMYVVTSRSVSSNSSPVILVITVMFSSGQGRLAGSRIHRSKIAVESTPSPNERTACCIELLVSTWLCLPLTRPLAVPTERGAGSLKGQDRVSSAACGKASER